VDRAQDKEFVTTLGHRDIKYMHPMEASVVCGQRKLKCHRNGRGEEDEYY